LYLIKYPLNIFGYLYLIKYPLNIFFECVFNKVSLEKKIGICI
jgi:hypothetical protein